MTADDVRGEDYEAARPVPARSGVTGDPWVVTYVPNHYWDLGYHAGVQAARDAAAAVPLTGGWTTPEGVIHEISREQVLAAIDALRGES